jgi:hypothetical protein
MADALRILSQRSAGSLYKEIDHAVLASLPALLGDPEAERSP